jgi:putative MATE family efflux protein
MKPDENTNNTIDPEAREEITKGVSLLTGEPKTAIKAMAWPIFVAMFLLTMYNIVDAVWVAGISSDALAAIGFVTPIFMIVIGFGNGIGAGVTSLISRRIGSKDKKGADSAAIHSLILALVLSVIFTILLVPLAESILLMLGAGDVIGLTLEYGNIIFYGTIFFILSNISYSILRAEGDTKRTMYAMAISAVLNMVLDPIFIYTLGMGIAGAAVATILSVASVNLILIYWFFIKRDTYINFTITDFSPDFGIIKKILSVGIPASLEFVIMSLLMIIINWILVIVGGTDAVAVYTTGWRVVMFAIIPLIAIATSVVAVAGAAYGGRFYSKMNEIYYYSLKLGIIISIFTAAVTWIFAPQITLIFTYSGESAHIAPTIIAFLQTMCFFYIFVPPGMMSGSLFQAVGKGMNSLVINLLRSLVFNAVFAWMFAFTFNMGQAGVWWGIVVGDIVGGMVGYLWASMYLRRILKYEDKSKVGTVS